MSDLTVVEWHAQFIRQAGWTRAVRNQLYRRVNLLRAERVLDVGCGTGVITEEMAARCKGQVIGVDIDAAMVEFAIRPFDGAQGRLCSGQALSDEEVWDLVAYLWLNATTPERLAMGETLYAKNCAACHGETGGGDGPGGRYLEEQPTMDSTTVVTTHGETGHGDEWPGGHLGKQPTDFTDARTMAGGSSDIYYAKIRRGGMGTGMPYWGTIFTEEETWSVVDYLWTFLFKD